MSGKAGKFVRLVSDPNAMRALATLRYNGYLLERGWFVSEEKGSPLDANGNPLPWMTYPFLAFIEPRLRPTMRMFEFGSGGSTQYFARRVQSVDSVEHDKTWHDRIAGAVPSNANVRFVELSADGNYCRSALATGAQYNIIVVDGRDRVNCMKQSVGALADDGVIVLDDAQRSEYTEGTQFLEGRGFRRLPFIGIGPCSVDEKSTDIFYRQGNCLNI